MLVSVSYIVEVSLVSVTLLTIDLGGEFTVYSLCRSLLRVFMTLISDSLTMLISVSRSIVMSSKAES
jgi:hypothetical protein